MKGTPQAVRYAPYADARQRKRPGLFPLALADWLEPGSDYARQMAERDRLIARNERAVYACLSGAERAAAEFGALVLGTLRHQPEFHLCKETIERPDGQAISPDAPPLLLAGRLVQEDFCLLEKGTADSEYVLSAAILCFPSRWSLAEKLGQPMTAIHAPVPDYSADLARRVNRIFEAIRPENPMWRLNWSLHHIGTLFQPVPPPQPERIERLFVRVERQSLRRLPQSGAVVFSIRTYIDPVEVLSPPQLAALTEQYAAYSSAEADYHGGWSFHTMALAYLGDLLEDPDD